MPVVEHPGIINPEDFLNEVLTIRFPNPFIPDTPARIATDTSLKIPVRFGETLRARKKAGLPADELEAIPLFFALFLRYSMAIDDSGAPMELSPDPNKPETLNVLKNMPFGQSPNLLPILSDASLFGVDLYAEGLANKVEVYFTKLSAGKNTIANVL